MPRIRRASRAVVLAVVACSRGGTAGTPEPDPRPLASYVAQRVAVTPAGFVRTDSLGWIQQLGGSGTAARRLDTAILAAFTERGLGARWLMPADLARSYERNRTYATDPYQLALEPLRSRNFETASRYDEPLSSQLRTMIALHEDARFVLVPVELRFERAGTGSAGTGVLRTALLDPRLAEARWVGELRGDTSSVPGRAIASVASRLADLFMVQ